MIVVVGGVSIEVMRVSFLIPAKVGASTPSEVCIDNMLRGSFFNTRATEVGCAMVR